jgi:hypothetical protein
VDAWFALPMLAAILIFRDWLWHKQQFGNGFFGERRMRMIAATGATSRLKWSFADGFCLTFRCLTSYCLNQGSAQGGVHVHVHA